jgi:hypothetical protein
VFSHKSEIGRGQRTNSPKKDEEEEVEEEEGFEAVHLVRDMENFSTLINRY